MAPLLHLSCAPTQPAIIASLFRSGEVQAILERPPVTRQDGFNVLTYERAHIVEGERLVIEAWRKRLELYKDGTFIATATFSDFLGWPRDGEAFARNPKVNSLALIEFTYDFLKTYEALLDFLTPLPTPLRCQLGLHAAHSLQQRLWMAPYAIQSVGFEHPYGKNEAPSDTVTRETEVEARAEKPHIQPGKIAYMLMEQLYNWFGLQSDAIPYASHDLQEIDPNAF